MKIVKKSLTDPIPFDEQQYVRLAKTVFDIPLSKAEEDKWEDYRKELLKRRFTSDLKDTLDGK